MAEKVTGKDLKELRKPDEFQLVAGKAMEFLIAHRRQFLIALGVVVALVVIAWGAAAIKQRGETKAGESLADALRVAARSVVGEGIAQPGEETFASRAERNKAASVAFEKVRAESPGSTAAHTATLQLGLLKQQTGDVAGAVPLLEEYLKAASAGSPLRATALEALGYAQESQGKLAEAKDAFAKLKDAGAPDRSAYQLARVALVEKKPNAREMLAAVAKDYAKEPVALEANLRLEVAGLPDAPAVIDEPKTDEPAQAPDEPKAAPKAPKKSAAPSKKKGR